MSDAGMASLRERYVRAQLDGDRSSALAVVRAGSGGSSAAVR